jgi:hypothetical protein
MHLAARKPSLVGIESSKTLRAHARLGGGRLLLSIVCTHVQISIESVDERVASPIAIRGQT